MSILRSYAESLGDPALSGRWLAYVGDASPTSLVVESINPSTIDIAAKPRHAGALTSAPYPDFASYQAVQMVLYENHHYTVTKWIEEWKKKIYNPDTQVYGLPGAYRKDMSIQLYPVDSNSPIAEFRMLSCWPNGSLQYSYDYQNQEGRIILQATFQLISTTFKTF